MDENRELILQNKRINLIIKNFVPESEVIKLQTRLVFSEEIDDWVIREDFEIERPGSVLGQKRPLCEYTKMAISELDSNPRHRPDNILMLDHNIMERTTEDLDPASLEVSDIVKQVIRTTLTDEEDIKARIVSEAEPFVFVMNADKLSREKVQKDQEKKIARNIKSAFRKKRD
jgi:hypothetical protein